MKSCAVASTASFNARDSSRSSIPGSSGAPLLAAFGWLSRGAITPTIATYDAADAVGILLTPQEPGLGGKGDLHRFGLRLAFALKNKVIQRRHTNRRRALLSSNK